MKRFFAALLAFILVDVSAALADSTSGIPAAPKDWGVFIRNGLDRGRPLVRRDDRRPALDHLAPAQGENRRLKAPD